MVNYTLLWTFLSIIVSTAQIIGHVHAMDKDYGSSSIILQWKLRRISFFRLAVKSNRIPFNYLSTSSSLDRSHFCFSVKISHELNKCCHTVLPNFWYTDCRSKQTLHLCNFIFSDNALKQRTFFISSVLPLSKKKFEIKHFLDR